jgi:hypothetical protein
LATREIRLNENNILLQSKVNIDITVDLKSRKTFLKVLNGNVRLVGVRQEMKRRHKYGKQTGGN